MFKMESFNIIYIGGYMYKKYSDNAFTILMLILSLYMLFLLMPFIGNLLGNIGYILLPFILGGAFAYIFHPLVDSLEEKRVNRGTAVIIVFAAIVYVILFISIMLIPILVDQFERFGLMIPDLSEDLEGYINDFRRNIEFIDGSEKLTIEQLSGEVMTNISGWIKNLANNVFSSLTIVITTPIITLYILYDYNEIKTRVKKFLNRKHFHNTYNFLDEFENQLGDYLRGLYIVIAVLSIISSLLFLLIGLDFPFLFGIIVGLTNVVPIIGPYIGGAIAFTFAFTQSYKIALMVLGIILLLQLLESNILTPYIQSKRISAHPLLILLSFFVFGNLLGFIGMVLAIPLLAFTMLLVKHFNIYRRGIRESNEEA